MKKDKFPDYNSKRMTEIYNFHFRFGALSVNLHRSQYGLSGNKIAEPTRYFFIYLRQLDLIADFVKEGSKVLDLGCGQGHIIERIERRAAHITGLDISIYRIRQAKERVNSKKAYFLVGDVMSFPFGKSEFDVVIASEIIEHLPDTLKLLANIRDVLKKDGTLIISTPVSLFFKDDRSNMYISQHLYLFSYRKLLKLLKKGGYTVRMAIGVGLKSPKLTIPVWLGSPLIKFVYCALKRIKPTSGYLSPIVLQFNLVCNPWFDKLYYVFKNKKHWAALMRGAGLLGEKFPCLASQIIIMAQKND